MAEGAEKLRRVRGGVGTLNTKCVSEFEAKNAAGDTGLGIKIPAGSIVIGAVIKNGANDLAGAGASVGLKLGNTEIITAETVATLKGGAIGGCYATGYPVAEDTEVKLEVSGAALTDGKLDICVLYM